MGLTARERLRSAAVILALATVAGVVWYAFFAPTRLRLAAPPAGTEVTQFLTALSVALDREQASVRVTVLPSPDTEPQNLEGGRFDLAVVRGDRVPRAALGVAVLHQYKVAVALKPGVEIERFADLRGHTIVVLGPANRAIVDRLMAFYGLPPTAVTVHIATNPEDVTAAARDTEVSALVAVGVQGGRVLKDAIAAFRSADGDPPRLLRLAEAETIAARHPSLGADEIAVGELGQSPPFPSEAIPTVSMPVLLVANRRLTNHAVFEFTRNLFALRASMMAEHAAAGRVEALSTERGAAFAVHPGAATYYDATEVGFLERYSDVLWLLLFGFGTVTSLAAWLYSLAFPRRRNMVEAERTELVALLARARAASSHDDLDAIEARVDQIVAETSNLLFQGTLPAEQQPAFDLLLGRLDAVILRRRQDLPPRLPGPRAALSE